MLELKESLILYHGSYCEVLSPNLRKCDLLVTMAVEEISTITGNDSKEVLVDFLASKTGKALYDDTTKLWWTGPSYIAEMYLEEIALKQ